MGPGQEVTSSRPHRESLAKLESQAGSQKPAHRRGLLGLQSPNCVPRHPGDCHELLETGEAQGTDAAFSRISHDLSQPQGQRIPRACGSCPIL